MTKSTTIKKIIIIKIKINSEKRGKKKKKTCEVLNHSDFENLAGPSGDLISTECMASDNNIYSNMLLED